MNNECKDGSPLRRLAVLTYDFPHRKSEMILTRLYVLGIAPLVVIGAPRVPIVSPPGRPRTRLHSFDLMHPSALCEQLGFNYLVSPHDDSLASVLGTVEPTLGLVAGARMLPECVLSFFSYGIVNLHPAILPGTRGLDSWLWDLYHKRPLGVTAHLIDARMDCGRKIMARTVVPQDDESIPEVWLRLLSAQVSLLGPALASLNERAADEWATLELGTAPPGHMPVEILRQLGGERGSW